MFATFKYQCESKTGCDLGGRHFLFRSLCVLCVLCGESFPARADEPLDEVQTIDGPSFQAQLKSIDEQGQAHFRTDHTVALDELVRYGHPADPRPQPLVLLAGGTQIVAAAAWSGNAPLSLVDDELVLQSDLLREMKIPRDALRGIVFAELRRVDDRRQLVYAMLAAAVPAEDEVALTNDEQIRGRISQIDRGTLTLQTNAGEAKLPLSRILSVAFANRSEQPHSDTTSTVAVGLRDGSLLQCTRILANESTLDAQLTGSPLTIGGGTVDDIISLQTLSSPRLQYISDRDPASYRHVPYLSIEWPYRLDHNVLGGPLQASGLRYLKGLGLHSASRITYSLDPADGWRRFEASVAVDDSAHGRGSVAFAVYVQRDGQWIPAFTSDTIRGGDPPIDASVDIGNATGLTLTVDYADRGDELDHADWLDARLLK